MYLYIEIECFSKKWNATHHQIDPTSLADNYYIGHVLTYNCQVGYQLINSAPSEQITCDSEGFWTSIINCER